MNDYNNVLIDIYLIADRKKNTTLIVFTIDTPFSRNPNMSLPARIHDSVDPTKKNDSNNVLKVYQH